MARAYLARRSHEDEPADEPAPVAVRYEQFRTVDVFAARRFFAGAYQPGWRLTGLASGSAVSHRRWQARSVTLDEVAIEGRARCEVPAADSVLVIQPRAGSLTVADGPIPTADCPVLVAHGISHALNLHAARFDVVSIAAARCIRQPRTGAYRYRSRFSSSAGTRVRPPQCARGVERWTT